MKSCSPWEGLTLEKFVENCLPWAGPHTGAGEECEESSPEEEGAAETTCDELTITPIPHPPAPLGGGGRETGVKLSLGREGWGEGVLRSGFISHYPTLIFLVMNYTPFSPKVQPVLFMTVIGEWSLPVLVSTLEPFITFPLPCPAEEAEWQSGFGGHLAFIQAKPKLLVITKLTTAGREGEMIKLLARKAANFEERTYEE